MEQFYTQLKVMLWKHFTITKRNIKVMPPLTTSFPLISNPSITPILVNRHLLTTLYTLKQCHTTIRLLFPFPSIQSSPFFLPPSPPQLTSGHAPPQYNMNTGFSESNCSSSPCCDIPVPVPAADGRYPLPGSALCSLPDHRQDTTLLWRGREGVCYCSLWTHQPDRLVG